MSEHARIRLKPKAALWHVKVKTILLAMCSYVPPSYNQTNNSPPGWGHALIRVSCLCVKKIPLLYYILHRVQHSAPIDTDVESLPPLFSLDLSEALRYTCLNVGYCCSRVPSGISAVSIAFSPQAFLAPVSECAPCELQARQFLCFCYTYF